MNWLLHLPRGSLWAWKDASHLSNLAADSVYDGQRHKVAARAWGPVADLRPPAQNGASAQGSQEQQSQLRRQPSQEGEGN